ncbi:leucine-rich repeat domain-containing protein, partial [Maribacter sp.]|nr:leucine-rich repeat domain-containing protein [Maribacter sp.]
MKKYINFKAILMVLSFLIHTSCKNDDDVPLVPDADVEDPDAVDVDDPDVSVDYLVLKALYETNTNNTLGWDLEDTSMKSWAGVILTNDRVTELRINLKNVTKLVPEIGQLAELTKLFTQDNSIEEIPLEVGDLAKLLWLSLYNNSIAELPVEISKLTNLEGFEITGNPLTVIPQEICDLELTGTNIQKNEFTMFCSGTLIDYEALKALYIQNPKNKLNWGNNNNVSDINMTNWEGVTLVNGRVDELFIGQDGFLSLLVPEIGNLEKLQSLHIQENPTLGRLPKEVGRLTDLKYLEIIDGQLIELPEKLWNLKKLQTLELKNTGLLEISDKIGNLSALKKLKLPSNDLTTLPAAVGTLPLEEFDLVNNPLISLPQAVCDQNP